MYCLFNCVVSRSVYVVLSGKMNRYNEAERMWKEVVGPNLSYCPRVHLEGLRKKE
jgi:hypothetical protein